MDDRLAWITGASTGIGNALALRMARDGWRIAASARSADTLEIMARESQGRISAHPLDVTDEAASAQVAETIWCAVDRLGLSFKKNLARRRARPPGRGGAAEHLAGGPGLCTASRL
jgi:NADP-dependent 3-hydroxy acid dehydrogenase YdfG